MLTAPPWARTTRPWARIAPAPTWASPSTTAEPAISTRGWSARSWLKLTTMLLPPGSAADGRLGRYSRWRPTLRWPWGSSSISFAGPVQHRHREQIRQVFEGAAEQVPYRHAVGSD